MGYVSSPEKGLYIITEKGKEALRHTRNQQGKSQAILAYAPHDKAFHFYVDIGKPLNLHAHNLRDFANKVEKADLGINAVSHESRRLRSMVKQSR